MKTVNEGKEFKFQEIWRFLQSKPTSIWVLLGLIGLGLALLLSGNELESREKNPSSFNQVKGDENNIFQLNSLSDEQRLERELTQTLKNIAGVGGVRVDVNLKVGNRKVWERQAHISKRVSQDQGAVNTEENTSDELVFAKERDGRDSPVLKEDLAPEIEGVIVVAEGANNSRVRELLTDTVTTILGLPAHRVLIIPGKFEKE